MQFHVSSQEMILAAAPQSYSMFAQLSTSACQFVIWPSIACHAMLLLGPKTKIIPISEPNCKDWLDAGPYLMLLCFPDMQVFIAGEAEALAEFEKVGQKLGELGIMNALGSCWTCFALLRSCCAAADETERAAVGEVLKYVYIGLLCK